MLATTVWRALGDRIILTMDAICHVLTAVDCEPSFDSSIDWTPWDHQRLSGSLCRTHTLVDWNKYMVCGLQVISPLLPWNGYHWGITRWSLYLYLWFQLSQLLDLWNERYLCQNADVWYLLILAQSLSIQLKWNVNSIYIESKNSLLPLMKLYS